MTEESRRRISKTSTSFKRSEEKTNILHEVGQTIAERENRQARQIQAVVAAARAEQDKADKVAALAVKALCRRQKG